MDGMPGAAIDVRQRASDRFPFTKFLPPVLDARVATGHLVERLHEAIPQRPLTVVVAPAGSGKTTALAAWVEAAVGDVVWVRLDVDDDEPSALATALLEAGRRQLGDEFGGRLAPILAYAGPAPSPRQLIAALVNDLGDHGPVTLVLDDVHALTEPTTLAFLEDLLDHLPPEVRVVLGSRVEPAVSLPRRRVRGQVAELRLDDLRLDRDAIRRVLSHDGAVTDEAVDAVLAASNGWAAAVTLATAHVGADPDSEVSVPVGVTDVLTDLRPFLTVEVLEALPERLRTFLLETSILEELTRPTAMPSRVAMTAAPSSRNSSGATSSSPVTGTARGRPGGPTTCSTRSSGSNWRRAATRQPPGNCTAVPAAAYRRCGHSRTCSQPRSTPPQRN